MLVSHRHHAPAPEIAIALDRAIERSFIARRVTMLGVAHDEAATAHLGKGTADARARLQIVLAGRLGVTARTATGEQARELGPGDVVVLPSIAQATTFGADNDVLEIDWDSDAPIARGPVASVTAGSLTAPSLEAALALAQALRSAGGGATPTLRASLVTCIRALVAEGLPFDARGASDLCASPDESHDDDQRLFSAIDRSLTDRLDVPGGPAIVDLESTLGWSRRTVTRRSAALHARYGLSGLDGSSWRSVRDFYRVLVGSILASSPIMTTRRLAHALGYGSPEAICHAFANAGMPSPGAIPKVS